MTKQEVLDIENPTTKQWTLQQLLVSMSRTELAAVRRITNRLMSIAYKTSAKEQQMEEFHQLVGEALEIASKEGAKDGTNEIGEVDSSNTVRGRKSCNMGTKGIRKRTKKPTNQTKNR